MVLYPLPSREPSSGEPSSCQPSPTPARTVPAWEAVERKQKQAASEWWLVAQPDHAALAGDLAARIGCPYFPALEPDILQAIALHDEGWIAFDNGEPRQENGRPLSFLEMPPYVFLQAWTASIERVQKTTPAGGILVSEHFCRIGKAALARGVAPQESQQIRQFLQSELQRQDHLFRQQPYSAEELAALVDVLQFCDLLSLYLCCGSRDFVEFPQKFKGQVICIGRYDDLSRTEPQIFGSGASLAVSARKFPEGRDAAVNIPILLD